MTELNPGGGPSLTGLNRINVLLGKNGCGKSVLLRKLQNTGGGIPSQIRYVVPERAGSLEYEAGVQQNLVVDPNWLVGQRRRNMVQNFMQQAVGQFAQMETIVLRRLEKTPALRNDPNFSFDKYTAAINGLLDHVEVRRDEKRSFILHRKNGTVANPGELSSGEAQLVALGIECLAFELDEKPGMENILLLDEPDVHIHPDLQAKLMKFIVYIVARSRMSVIVATHSTAILGALESNKDATVCFMKADAHELAFVPISDALRKILPVFGAHPLSNLFNEMPLLLVEGTDEERIWQQAVRTSQGRIRFYPCECGGIDKMDIVEQEANKVIGAVYDNGTAYSLRDCDETNGTIPDLGAIKRRRLQWRASENLLLTDDVLARWGTDWSTFQGALSTWVTQNSTHQAHAVLKQFVMDNYPRETADLKQARNIIAGLLKGSKSWEILIGQTLGEIDPNKYPARGQVGSLHAALGDNFFEIVFPRS